MCKKEITTNDTRLNNISKNVLKQNFANCFDKDSNFMIDKFQKELEINEVCFSRESYSLDWLGKSYARLLACDPATTLLKENENHNKENINSQNLLIKGDNLEVLKHLTHAYYEKIKMIYIDPPYNTGSDGFIYEDNRKFSIQELKNLAGIDEDKAKRILDFTQSKSNSHSAWLTFMYPRLYIAKRLLKDDGAIFISIDDNEVAQLKMLMDEVFGEENFVANLPTIMNLKGNNDEFAFAGTHEYTVVYAKNKELATFNHFNLDEDNLDDWEIDEYGYFKQGANLKATGTNAPKEKRPNLYFPIYIDSNNVIFVTDDDLPPDNYTGDLTKLYPVTNGQDMSWRWSKSKIKNEPDNLIVSRNGTLGIYKKQRPALGDLPSKKPKTLFYKAEYSSGNGTKQLTTLLGDRLFPNPKPIELIKDLISLGSNKNDIILDFFAGSGTTADAIMQLNAEDCGKRRFILVQIAEPIDKKKNKIAYDFVKNELKISEPTIFEITKERLFRSAQRVKNEIIEPKIAEKHKQLEELNNSLPTDETNNNQIQLNSEIKDLQGLDFGFKIFDTIPIWEDYDFQADDFDENDTLFDISKLDEADIKALLITWKTYDGLCLADDLEIVKIGDYSAYYGKGKLYLMDIGFNTENMINLLEKVDSDKGFNPNAIIVFGHHFQSKNIRELSENIKSYANKKNIDFDLIVRY